MEVNQIALFNRFFDNYILTYPHVAYSCYRYGFSTITFICYCYMDVMRLQRIDVPSCYYQMMHAPLTYRVEIMANSRYEDMRVAGVAIPMCNFFKLLPEIIPLDGVVGHVRTGRVEVFTKLCETIGQTTTPILCGDPDITGAEPQIYDLGIVHGHSPEAHRYIALYTCEFNSDDFDAGVEYVMRRVETHGPILVHTRLFPLVADASFTSAIILLSVITGYPGASLWVHGLMTHISLLCPPVFVFSATPIAFTRIDVFNQGRFPVRVDGYRGPMDPRPTTLSGYTRINHMSCTRAFCDHVSSEPSFDTRSMPLIALSRQKLLAVLLGVSTFNFNTSVGLSTRLEQMLVSLRQATGDEHFDIIISRIFSDEEPLSAFKKSDGTHLDPYAPINIARFFSSLLETNNPVAAWEEAIQSIVGEYPAFPVTVNTMGSVSMTRLAPDDPPAIVEFANNELIVRDVRYDFDGECVHIPGEAFDALQYAQPVQYAALQTVTLHIRQPSTTFMGTEYHGLGGSVYVHVDGEAHVWYGLHSRLEDKVVYYDSDTFVIWAAAVLRLHRNVYVVDADDDDALIFMSKLQNGLLFAGTHYEFRAIADHAMRNRYGGYRNVVLACAILHVFDAGSRTMYGHGSSSDPSALAAMMTVCYAPFCPKVIATLQCALSYVDFSTSEFTEAAEIIAMLARHGHFNEWTFPQFLDEAKLNDIKSAMFRTLDAIVDNIKLGHIRFDTDDTIKIATESRLLAGDADQGFDDEDE